MKGKFKLFALLLICMMTLGGSIGAYAETICDTDVNAIPYEPTLDVTTFLNDLLNFMGSSGDVPLEITSDEILEGLANTHLLLMDITTSMDISGVSFSVIPAVGSLDVNLSLPGITDADVLLSVIHADCYDPEAYSSCTDACGLDVFCLLACEACELENSIFDGILDGQTALVSWNSAQITQTADICVTGDCQAVHPLESTTVVTEGLVFDLLEPDGGIWGWLYGAINALIPSMIDLDAEIAESFEDDSGPLLIEVFSLDIKNDGCSPVPEVTNCQGAACSMATKPDVSARQGASLLLYSLPVLVMGGLILWRRRR